MISQSMNRSIQVPLPGFAIPRRSEYAPSAARSSTRPLPAANRPAVAILGVPFDNVTAAEAVERVKGMITSGKPHYVVTANVDFLVQARSDIELRRILVESHLVLCDGTPLLWASRFLGNPLPERVAGSDLVPLLLEAAAEEKYRVFLLGATPDCVQRAASRLEQQYPELALAGHYSPPFNTLLEMDHDEIKRRIADARPDLLLIAFGCPKAEKWIAMHYRSLGVPVAIGVGATIDFLAGQVRRAPVWMRRTGVEWLFRLAQEPRRLFKRYMKDFWVFGRHILAQWAQLQLLPAMAGASRLGWAPATRQPGGAKGCTSLVPGEKPVIMRMPERLNFTTMQNVPWPDGKTLTIGRHYLIEMDGVRSIDSTGVGFLIRLQKQARAAGRLMVLVAPSRAVRRALALARMEDFFDCAPNLAVAEQIVAARKREQASSVTFHLVWQGEITAANARTVWQRTRAYVNSLAHGSRHIVDLAQTRFMDSTGLDLMVRAQKLARRREVNLVFANPQPAVAQVIHAARLESVILDQSAPEARLEW